MAGARKKILNTAIIAVAVIAAATLFFFLTIMFAFNKEAAICDYLDKNGVTQEDLSLIVSGSESVADTFKGDETSYYEGVNALYALAVKAADNRAVVEGAVDAYYNAPRIGNPFAVLKYSSILQELAPLKDNISYDTSSAVGEKEIGESVRQILKICEGIAENGKNSAGKILFILKTRLSYIANQRRGQQAIPRRRGEMRRTRLPREAGGAVFLRAARQARKRRVKNRKKLPLKRAEKIENSANAILNRKQNRKRSVADDCGAHAPKL